MRVIVCGGRSFGDYGLLCTTLNKIHQETPISAIICGLAKGADFLAFEWAFIKNIPRNGYPADWDKHGRSAGPIRNRKMLRESNPDLVVAFPGHTGTADMATIAKRAGVEVRHVTKESPHG